MEFTRIEGQRREDSVNLVQSKPSGANDLYHGSRLLETHNNQF